MRLQEGGHKMWLQGGAPQDEAAGGGAGGREWGLGGGGLQHSRFGCQVWE